MEDARELLKNGIGVVSEGSNMPSTLDAVQEFQSAKLLYAPSKAANAGGVAVSGLEQTQNATRLQWSRDEVYSRLPSIMREIHDRRVAYGDDGERVDYVRGANLAGFVKVADAMLAHGVV